MGKQHNKVQKRRRRKEYLERKRVAAATKAKPKKARPAKKAEPVESAS